MKEMSAGLFEEQEWEEEEEGKKEGSNEEEGEVTTITGINPPVRRDKEKTENERRKMKIKKEEVGHLICFTYRFTRVLVDCRWPYQSMCLSWVIKQSSFNIFVELEQWCIS